MIIPKTIYYRERRGKHKIDFQMFERLKLKVLRSEKLSEKKSLAIVEKHELDEKRGLLNRPLEREHKCRVLKIYFVRGYKP